MGPCEDLSEGENAHVVTVLCVTRPTMVTCEMWLCCGVLVSDWVAPFVVSRPGLSMIDLSLRNTITLSRQEAHDEISRFEVTP